ncbi:zinc finger protein 878-like isoform X2 [Aphidius gifuensis]|uniref:zinc finger protein 878-like isoform X2 n=1 Tax=Aphidius gifuensis TaxID=684658 RepID=UPI001CDC69F7|nr:zinc finger protein 878-like isoform X2 [Aphidius gifuensis]
MDDEAAQAVLLRGMEGTQYITIQRTEVSDSESLENQSYMTINMVTDMINGVGTEYNTATQYYAADDLLNHDVREDRKLASALVTVQFQAQHKHQQTQPEADSSLPDVSQLATLDAVNTYEIQSIPVPITQQTTPPVHAAMQPFKRINHHVKQEFINVKSEYDIDISADSSEDANPSSGRKRSLPHKKRIARKLKQHNNKNPTNKKNTAKVVDQEIISIEANQEIIVQLFKCEICETEFGGQLKFFEHLKSHYEPVKQETKVVQITNSNMIISPLQNIQTMENNEVEEEFSEPEDLMEGIRGVVEETGAHIDDEAEPSSLNGVDTSSTLWSITDVVQSVNQEQLERSTINEQNLQSDALVAGEITKKKKTAKQKKTKDDMTCPQCDRSFHHKNSLIYHLRSHTGERPHQCEVCGKSFFAASALKVHKRLHSGDKPYKCEDCGRHFRQWGDLKYHSMSIHSEQRQFQCEYCGKDFARKYSLIVHRRIHTGEKNYRCEYCNKTFRASSYLQNHRRIHTGEKPHPCTVCGKPFRVRSDMKRHMQTHNRGRTERPASRSASSKNIANINENDKNDNARTIQDLVQELKLEIEPNNVVDIVSPEDNPESILPHEGGQNLEYSVVSAQEENNDRDPLEAVRTSDTLQYFFM